MLSRRTIAWSWGTMTVFVVLFTVLADQFAPSLVLPSMGASVIVGMVIGAVVSSRRASLIKWPESWI